VPLFKVWAYKGINLIKSPETINEFTTFMALLKIEVRW
jgi:hypothetical protein